MEFGSIKARCLCNVSPWIVCVCVCVCVWGGSSEGALKGGVYLFGCWVQMSTSFLQDRKLTDWPFEALFVSQGCCPHIWELCFQEPIHPSCKRNNISITMKTKRTNTDSQQESTQRETQTGNQTVSEPGRSLFVPSAVMNEVLNLLILYVDLYTLQHKKTHRSDSCFAFNNQLISHVLALKQTFAS